MFNFLNFRSMSDHIRRRLKESKESAVTTSVPKLFQSAMVRGRKEYRKLFTSDCGRMNWCWLPLIGWGSRSKWWYASGTSTRLWTTLYSKLSLLDFRLSASSFQPRSLTTAEMDIWSSVRLCGVLVTKRTALCWVISSRLMSFWWWGSQTLEQYSSLGRTYDIYAFSFRALGQCLRLRATKPSIRFAAPLMLEIWASQVSFSVKVTPRYLVLLTPSCRWTRFSFFFSSSMWWWWCWESIPHTLDNGTRQCLSVGWSGLP